GPPGTGKTLLAKAVAGEANVPFLSISGSEFVEMFVGVGASRVRDLFDKGKKNAPCIIFIDEIDAVGRHRGAGLGGGHDEREQTLNQLLVEMDGFEPNEGVIIMAATNRPDVLDPALLRPGRFDRRIVVSRPDLNGREGILKIHTREVILEEGVDLALIARGTPGLSGADLANLVNEAALLAARRGKNTVSMQEFEDAKDKVLMGIERKSLIISPEEKRIIAYHESGHALLAQLLEYTDPVHKVTIIPRGMALGVTQQLPVSDKYNYSKKYLLDEICVLLGGRASEEIFLDMKTTGSENDLEKVTNLARHMVCNWGMSDKVGPLTLGKKEGEIFLGKEISTTSHLSEDTTKLIDSEIKAIVMSQMELAKEILLKNKSILEEVVKYLLTYEVLTGEDIKDIIQGKDLAKIKLLQKNKAKAKEARKKRKARKKKVIAEMELSRDAKSDEDNSVLDFVKQVKDEDSGQDKEIKTDLKSPDE
ncbi:ATP-dependent zinc metalloprotease FtsH, partial [Candidatus Dependentiae bacterium]|nr:ATP-dependent zinc metalloprotease FtsH [Candidatus Dependentiae bacterium]